MTHALLTIALMALVAPMAAITTAAAFADHPDSDAARPELADEMRAAYETLKMQVRNDSNANDETSLPIAYSTGENVTVMTGTHAEYVEIYEDSTIEMLALDTFEDARVLSVQEIPGFDNGGIISFVQTIQQLDDGEIKQNLIIEIPQAGEEQNDALIIYNIGASATN